MIVFEKLEKTGGKKTNRFLKNPAKRPKICVTIGSKTKLFRDVCSFSSKSGYSYFLDMYMTKYEQNGATGIGKSLVKLQNIMFIQQSTLVPKTDKNKQPLLEESD